MKFAHFSPLKIYCQHYNLLYSIVQSEWLQPRPKNFQMIKSIFNIRGEVEPNPCDWKVLASYISKVPWRETPTILSFFDNISSLPEICSFSENYPLTENNPLPKFVPLTLNIHIPSVLYSGEWKIRVCGKNLNTSTFCTLLSVYCILVWMR